jgi:hypothetical protein
MKGGLSSATSSSAKSIPTAAGQGYIYTNDGGVTLGITTAFDASAQGQTPSFSAATVNPSCVGGSQHAFKLAHIASHSTARLVAR